MAALRIPEAALAALGLSLALAAPPWPAGAAGREDVPAEIAARTNPVTELPPARVEYYAKQFKAQCARCHGAAGDGGGAEAAELAVQPADFTDAATMRTRSDGQLFYQILAGGKPRSAMPAFGPASPAGWSEEKIWGMVAYVRLFAAPPQEPPR